MQHFPIFLNTAGKSVVLAGGGAEALAKLRLLMKTQAALSVHAPQPAPDIALWAAQGRLTLQRRALEAGDISAAALVYAASGDPAEDARVADLARAAGVPVNLVDNLAASDFITPAIVDRDPVTVAIGTEGTAPVLAREIKRELEQRLPAATGLLARAAQGFRRKAQALAPGAPRRDFWHAFFRDAGPAAAAQGPEAVRLALADLLARHRTGAPRRGHVAFVGAGPGDPDLLTMKARRALDEADVVIHDRLVPAAILDLARREATIVETGKTGFGPSWSQQDIDALVRRHAVSGARVVRLKSGDPTVFGRLDEEIEACEAAGLDWSVVPGITAASAAVAAIGQSLTRRGRNADMRLLTGHDVDGFADHDWRALAAPGAVAGIYMGKGAARFLQGRLLMHGADPATPVSVVENAARPDQRILSLTLGQLEPGLGQAGLSGPALLLLGLAPRHAAEFAETPKLEAAQ